MNPKVEALLREGVEVPLSALPQEGREAVRMFLAATPIETLSWKLCKLPTRAIDPDGALQDLAELWREDWIENWQSVETHYPAIKGALPHNSAKQLENVVRALRDAGASLDPFGMPQGIEFPTVRSWRGELQHLSEFGRVLSILYGFVEGAIPPITCLALTQGITRIDGWHRLCAAKILRRQTIQAFVGFPAHWRTP